MPISEIRPREDQGQPVRDQSVGLARAPARSRALSVWLFDTVFAPPLTRRSYPIATENVIPVRAPILPFTEL